MNYRLDLGENVLSIGLPDYTLGLLYHHEAQDARPGYSLLPAGSHGLGDNPDVSYSQRLDVGEDGKGVFAAAEIFWQNEHGVLRLGAWNSGAGLRLGYEF